MKPVLTTLFGLLFWILSSSVARAEFTAKTAYDFMAAQTAVYENGTSESVEKFLAYLSDDVKDIHVAYDREFSGKDHFRENMPKKSKALISYEMQVKQVIVGTNVAIIIFAVQAEEKKSDGRISNYNGGTVMVLDFDDDGLITQMKRYQD
jgi:acylphosphatase